MKKTLLKTSMVILMFSLLITKMQAYTAVMNGDWSNAATWGGIAPGSNVVAQDIIIPSGINVNLDIDVTFNGLLNNFTVNGSLTGGTNSVTIGQGNLTGSGPITVSAWIFDNLFAGTTPYTGLMTAAIFRTSAPAISLNADVNISDTLDVNTGTLTLLGSSDLTPLAGSTVRINNGTIIEGGGTFVTANPYDLVYDGLSKTTGPEFDSNLITALHIMLDDNAQTLSTDQDGVINGLIHLESGNLDFSGDNLTMNGDYQANPASNLTSDATSELFIQGGASLTDSLTFTAASVINNVTVDLSDAGANVELGNALTINGMLRLLDGDFILTTGSTLTMGTGSTFHIEGGLFEIGSGTFAGSNAYNVEYMGGSVGTNDELSGSGMTNVTVNLAGSGSILTLNDSLIVPGAFNLTNGTLFLNNNHVILNGTMNTNPMGNFSSSSTSDIILNLTTAAGDTLYFATGGNVVDDLNINIAAGSAMVLGSTVEIANKLDLLSGKLDISNSNLIIQPSASIFNYSDTKYVITSGTGKVTMRVTFSGAYVLFPIGTVQNYSPASIQQTALGTTGDFSIGVVNDVYAYGSGGVSVTSNNSLVTKTWFIDAAAGVIVNMNLKLAWQAASEVNGFDRTEAYVSHYTTFWDSIPRTAATSGPFMTYELTRSGIPNLNTSAFAVMDNAIVVGIEELTAADLKLYPNPTQDQVTIEMPANAELAVEIMDLSGKVIQKHSSNKQISSFDVSNLDNGYYFIRITDVNSKQSVVKRFIKQ